jgi:hypothetical protein
MASKEKYTAEQMRAAVPGTGGIVTAIAHKVGCDTGTFLKYKAKYATVKAAYDAEVDSTLDVAESVLLDNIRLARRFQSENKTVVDTSDSKWYLTKKGKHRGYGDALQVSGPDDGPIVIEINGKLPD